MTILQNTRKSLTLLRDARDLGLYLLALLLLIAFEVFAIATLHNYPLQVLFVVAGFLAPLPLAHLLLGLLDRS